MDAADADDRSDSVDVHGLSVGPKRSDEALREDELQHDILCGRGGGGFRSMAAIGEFGERLGFPFCVSVWRKLFDIDMPNKFASAAFCLSDRLAMRSRAKQPVRLRTPPTPGAIVAAPLCSLYFMVTDPWAEK